MSSPPIYVYNYVIRAELSNSGETSEVALNVDDLPLSSPCLPRFYSLTLEGSVLRARQELAPFSDPRALTVRFTVLHLFPGVTVSQPADLFQRQV